MVLEFGLAGKRVLVTASSKGIGFAAAKAFLLNGSRVVVSSSNRENVRGAVDSLASLGEVYGYTATCVQRMMLRGWLNTLPQNSGD